MITFTNTSGGALDVPALDLHIAAGGTFEVDDLAAAGLRSQPEIWTEGLVGTKSTPTSTPTPDATPTDAATTTTPKENL